MEAVIVQIKEAGKSWEETIAVQHTFPNWEEVTNFAYRLALQVNREVRVQSKGSGHYYSPTNAQWWFDRD